MKVHPLEHFWPHPWHNHGCKQHWYHRNCFMRAFVSYKSWLYLGVEIFPGQDLPTHQVVLQYELQEATVLSSLFCTSYRVFYWKTNIRKINVIPICFKFDQFCWIVYLCIANLLWLEKYVTRTPMNPFPGLWWILSGGRHGTGYSINGWVDKSVNCGYINVVKTLQTYIVQLHYL